MRTDGRRSSNNEDRRGGGSRRMGAGLKLGGGATIIVIAIALFMGKDPRALLALVSGGETQVSETRRGKKRATKKRPGENKVADFVSVVLADTEDTYDDKLSCTSDTCEGKVRPRAWPSTARVPSTSQTGTTAQCGRHSLKADPRAARRDPQKSTIA